VKLESLFRLSVRVRFWRICSCTLAVVFRSDGACRQNTVGSTFWFNITNRRQCLSGGFTVICWKQGDDFPHISVKCTGQLSNRSTRGSRQLTRQKLVSDCNNGRFVLREFVRCQSTIGEFGPASRSSFDNGRYTQRAMPTPYEYATFWYVNFVSCYLAVILTVYGIRFRLEHSALRASLRRPSAPVLNELLIWRDYRRPPQARTKVADATTAKDRKTSKGTRQAGLGSVKCCQSLWE